MHTPGPWFVSEDYHGGSTICMMRGATQMNVNCRMDAKPDCLQANKANAALIAAAPDLLTACKAAQKKFQSLSLFSDAKELNELLKKAIEKAEGHAN